MSASVSKCSIQSGPATWLVPRLAENPTNAYLAGNPVPLPMAR
jgi:hypothetical protein